LLNSEYFGIIPT